MRSSIGPPGPSMRALVDLRNLGRRRHDGDARLVEPPRFGDRQGVRRRDTGALVEQGLDLRIDGHDFSIAGGAPSVRRGETDAEGLQVGRDPLGQKPDLAQVAHQAAMQVAAEVLAEGGLVAAGRPLAPVTPDLLELGFAEAHFLVGGEREDAGQRAAERPHREILHLAMLGFRRLADDGRQRQHGEAHVARLVLQDAATDLAQHLVLGGLRQHAEQRHGEGLGDQLQADRLEVPRRGAEQRVEDLPDVAADRIDLAVEAQLEIALQHLVVARLVGHLGRLEQLGVLALHVLHELAAQQHGAMLALHQGREPPAADAAVELDAVLPGKPIPEVRAVDVHEIVGDQPAIALERHRPVDVGGGVPLVDLRLLVEPAQVRLVAAVVVAEVRGVARLDLVPVVHNVPPCRSLEEA